MKQGELDERQKFSEEVGDAISMIDSKKENKHGRIDEIEAFSRLVEYFKKTPGITLYKITTPPTLFHVSQRGENCKLVALATAIDHARNTLAYKSPKIPLSENIPLYKNKSVGPSLRRIAKDFGSVVGEMYSLQSLVKTCHKAGYDCKTFAPSDEAQYIKQLEKLIDADLMPMVFYNIGRRDDGDLFGYPTTKGEGKNEHAATVVAYYKNTEDKTLFIIKNRGGYYIYDGMELAISAFSLAKQREVETFRKIQRSNGETWWVLQDRIHEYTGIVLESEPARTAKHMSVDDTPLKGKIMVVLGPRGHLNSNSFFTRINQTKLPTINEEEEVQEEQEEQSFQKT